MRSFVHDRHRIEIDKRRLQSIEPEGRCVANLFSFID